MKLNEMKASPGASKKPFRKGRGVGTGNGKTGGRGHKGQNARAGGGVRPGFEGGQMPMARRLPKRGFRNPFRKEFIAVNILDLCRKFSKGAVIDEAALLQSGLIKTEGAHIKILAKGDIDFPVTLKIARISPAAKDKIIAAGGSVEEVI